MSKYKSNIWTDHLKNESKKIIEIFILKAHGGLHFFRGNMMGDRFDLQGAIYLIATT